MTVKMSMVMKKMTSTRHLPCACVKAMRLRVEGNEIASVCEYNSAPPVNWLRLAIDSDCQVWCYLTCV